MRTGVVANPVAGMDGRVGLKGTDGKVAEARAHGAEPRSPERARWMPSRLFETASEAGLPVWGSEMDTTAARDASFDPGVPGEPSGDETSAASTVAAAEAFVDIDADPVLFVGGDGIAADVAEALDGTDMPMLGVPAGVRVYSSVLAVSSEDVAHVVISFERTEAHEIMGIGEDDYRGGEVRPELRIAVHVPVAEGLQSSKQTGGDTAESLVAGAADDIRSTEGVTYTLGPGSIVGTAKAELGIDGSSFDVDVHRDDEVPARNATEAEILASPGVESVIVVTPIGGQGFVFGRGDPQLLLAVVRRYDVSVVASRSRLGGIPVLRIDIDGLNLDTDPREWIKACVDHIERRTMKTE